MQWLEHTMQVAPCSILNAFREIRAALVFLREVATLSPAALDKNKATWPRTTPALPRCARRGVHPASDPRLRRTLTGAVPVNPMHRRVAPPYAESFRYTGSSKRPATRS